MDYFFTICMLTSKQNDTNYCTQKAENGYFIHFMQCSPPNLELYCQFTNSCGQLQRILLQFVTNDYEQ